MIRIPDIKGVDLYRDHNDTSHVGKKILDLYSALKRRVSFLKNESYQVILKLKLQKLIYLINQIWVNRSSSNL